MRSNFANNVRKIKIDIRKEYDKLYELYTEEFISDFQGREYSFEMIFVEHFTEYHFADTCLSLDEFNDVCGYNFEENPPHFDIDYLIRFCEYFYNLLIWLPHKFYEFYTFHIYEWSFVIQHISKVIENLGYMQSQEDGFTIFVEKDAVVTTVSSVVPEEISYRILSYNHHSYKGNIDGKRETLVKLAFFLEPKESALAGIDGQFKSDLFYLLNTLGLRHNNLDPEGKQYKAFVANMTKEELEHWYDETYQMCLLAFLRIEHIKRKKAINELKKKVEAKDGNT